MPQSFATIFTPQGDGNAQVLMAQVLEGIEFATIFTPQGDGNYELLIKRILHCQFATIFTPQGDGNFKHHLIPTQLEAI